MTTDQWGVLLLYIAAPATLLFPFLYVLSARWWGTLTGTAVVISKFGLAGLVGAALIYHLHGDVDYPLHDQLVLVAFGLIALGTWLYLFALIRVQIMSRKAEVRVAEAAPVVHQDRP
jgi:hypothetical protein